MQVTMAHLLGKQADLAHVCMCMHCPQKHICYWPISIGIASALLGKNVQRWLQGQSVCLTNAPSLHQSKKKIVNFKATFF